MAMKKRHSPIPGSFYFSERLVRALSHIHACPLTIVHAPLGYGKTVAVREQLRAGNARVIWVGTPHGGEAAFWREFCRALKQGLPGQAEIVQTLLRMGYPADAVLAEAACDLLLRLDFTPETVLVIDDIHLLHTYCEREATSLADSGAGAAGQVGDAKICLTWQRGVTSGGMVKLCEMLAGKKKSGLHIVCISRYPYGEPGILQSLRGSVRIVGDDLFALNQREIKKYFEHCGIRLSMVQAQSLLEQTGGWISALYLHLLRYSKYEKNFRPEGVNGLLENEVFEPLSMSAREVLLATCRVEGFTKAQADFLCGVDTANALAELREKNSFLHYDTLAERYSTHAIFQSFMCGRLQMLPLERQKALLRKNADWFYAAGDYMTACEFFHAAGDFDRALTILEDSLIQPVVTEKAHFFMQLFKDCPPSVLEKHLGAAFKHALAALSVGDTRVFAERLAWIAAQCGARAENLGQNNPEVRQWRGELEVLLALADYNDIAAMSEHHRKATNCLAGPRGCLGKPPGRWGLRLCCSCSTVKAAS